MEQTKQIAGKSITKFRQRKINKSRENGGKWHGFFDEGREWNQL